MFLDNGNQFGGSKSGEGRQWLTSRIIACLRFVSKGVQTKMLREIQYTYFRMIRSENNNCD